jgi:hypothetical protein
MRVRVGSERQREKLERDRGRDRDTATERWRQGGKHGETPRDTLRLRR